ncbi:hypothetical protein JCM9533A_10500 [Catenuloplanes niger JCM 9533]
MMFLDDRAHDGLTPGGLVRLAEGDEDLAIAFLVDGEALRDPEYPVVAVDLADEPGRAFRVIADEVFSVQTNLDLATTDFAGYARAAGRVASTAAASDRSRFQGPPGAGARAPGARPGGPGTGFPHDGAVGAVAAGRVWDM